MYCTFIFWFFLVSMRMSVWVCVRAAISDAFLPAVPLESGTVMYLSENVLRFQAAQCLN